jgi:hypothetical protein
MPCWGFELVIKSERDFHLCCEGEGKNGAGDDARNARMDGKLVRQTRALGKIEGGLLFEFESAKLMS